MKNLKEKLNKKLHKNGGFTLMEMLIVIAIIAILIAIAIPTFSSQLENAREGTDAANIRSAYAEIMTDIATKPNDAHSKTVTLVQTQDDWQNTEYSNSLDKLKVTGNSSTGKMTVDITGTPKGQKTVTLSYATASGSNEPKLTIAFAAS